MIAKHYFSIAAALCLSFGSLSSSAQERNLVHGVEISRWVKEIEPNRYASSRDYKRTIKFFRDQFKGVRGVRWHAEVNLPSVKYIFIENRKQDRLWDGIHIYKISGGKIRFFILPHEEEKTTAEPSGKKAAKAKPLTSGVVKAKPTE